MEADTQVPIAQAGLVVRSAERFGLEPAKFLGVVKSTCFRTEKPISNEQLAALLVICERYGLDPFAKHVYAFPDRGGGIVPVVSIDGWIAVVNRQPLLDGIDFIFDEAQGAMTCSISIKGRSHPVRVTEFVSECRRSTEIWKTMPRRMIRHRALVQCARVAFGLSGIYDEEEAEDMINRPMPRIVSPVERQPSNAERLQSMTRDRDPPVDVADIMPTPAPTAAPEPAAPSLVAFIGQMERAADDFTADMILEEAREYLNEDEQQELIRVRDAKFATTDQPEGDQ
jgi:phage recombination protein Bet